MLKKKFIVACSVTTETETICKDWQSQKEGVKTPKVKRNHAFAREEKDPLPGEPTPLWRGEGQIWQKLGGEYRTLGPARGKSHNGCRTWVKEKETRTKGRMRRSP